jgi:chaperonin GroES
VPDEDARDPDALPIRMLHDRVLVSTEGEAGERRSSGGILIPATVAIGRRLAWAVVVAVGSNVRTVKINDRVLFDPEDRAEVEVRGKDYVLLRERDLHAVAAERLQDGKTGLYLERPRSRCAARTAVLCAGATCTPWPQWTDRPPPVGESAAWVVFAASKPELDVRVRGWRCCNAGIPEQWVSEDWPQSRACCRSWR